MIRELRRKFILMSMLLVSMVLLVVFTALCVSSYRQIRQEGDAALQMALNRREDQHPPTLEIGKRPPSDFNRFAIFVLRTEPDGDVSLQFSDAVSLSEAEASQIARAALAAEGEQGRLRDYNLRFRKREEGGGMVRIAFLELSAEQAVLRNTILTSGSLACLALTAFFLISLFLSGWALRPVERAWQRQRQFVSDASHELKTPLTVILANTGILKSNRTDTIARQINWVENTEAEARRMKELVDNLLFLAKADESAPQPPRGLLNLSDLLCSAALTFESVAFERGVSIHTEGIAEGIRVQGDEAQMRQLISILLDNAVKYSVPGGLVTVALKTRQARAQMSVHNMGTPLSPEELRHLFERFYRADGSRAQEGYGLGLSIAKTIAELHQGKLTVESDAARGTTFVALLPL